MATSLHELAARFWAAAKYRRHAAPDAPQQDQALRILRDVSTKSTGRLRENALQLLKEPTNDDSSS